jgi:pimeloyl-ACP methyl ester carboxylesterase
MTHGWPGSVIELLDTIGALTDPTAHGGTPEDAFHLVLPSLPGYGFSSEPAELGWESGRVARAWAELMHRLGCPRYVAQGGDVGALVTDLMGRQAVEGLVGYHLNLLAAVLAVGDQLPKESEQKRAAAEAVAAFREDGFGYFLEMATRPQTIDYSLLDSPVGLAAWLLDHDTDSHYKTSRAFVDGEPVGNLTSEAIVDNITLYWLTGTAASAARSYWEDAGAPAASLASGQTPPAVTVPMRVVVAERTVGSATTCNTPRPDGGATAQSDARTGASTTCCARRRGVKVRSSPTGVTAARVSHATSST